VVSASTRAVCWVPAVVVIKQLSILVGRSSGEEDVDREDFDCFRGTTAPASASASISVADEKEQVGCMTNEYHNCQRLSLLEKINLELNNTSLLVY